MVILFTLHMTENLWTITVQYSTVLYSTVQYSTIQYLIEGQQHEVTDGAVDEHEHVLEDDDHVLVLYCTVLYCSVLCLEDDDHVLLRRHHAHVHHLRVKV